MALEAAVSPKKDYRTGMYKKLSDLDSTPIDYYLLLAKAKPIKSPDMFRWPKFRCAIEIELLDELENVYLHIERLTEVSRRITRKSRQIAQRRMLKQLAFEIDVGYAEILRIFEEIGERERIILKKLLLRFGIPLKPAAPPPSPHSAAHSTPPPQSPAAS